MEEEVERIFQHHKNGRFNNVTNGSPVQQPKHLMTSSPNISRPHSDDSGLVEEEHLGPDITGKVGFLFTVTFTC